MLINISQDKIIASSFIEVHVKADSILEFPAWDGACNNLEVDTTYF